MPCPLVAGPKSIYGDPGQDTSRLSQLIQSSTRNGRMMTDVSLDELGPVDYLVVEFPAGESNFTGEMAKELLALVNSGIIRVIDVLILTKDAERCRRGDGALRCAGNSASCRQSRPSWRNCWPRKTSSTTRRGDGAGQHRRSAHLGEPMGCPIRISGAAFGWSTDRQRTDPDSSDHRLHRGRRGNRRTKETEHATQTSTCRTSRGHRRAGRQDCRRRRGRHTRTRRAGRQDCGRGRGRHTWAPSPHLARPQRRMLSEVLGLTKGGRFVLPVLRPHGRPLPVGGKV